jgi:hypothetical protein
MMEDSTSAGLHPIRCPFCEVYGLEYFGNDSACCASCRGTLDAKLLSTTRRIQALPDALETHPCEERGPPEMRRLPDGVFYCPACGSEVLPAGGSAESGGSRGASEAYLSGWYDGLFGRAENFTGNKGLARWEGGL